MCCAGKVWPGTACKKRRTETDRQRQTRTDRDRDKDRDRARLRQDCLSLLNWASRCVSISIGSGVLLRKMCCAGKVWPGTACRERQTETNRQTETDMDRQAPTDRDRDRDRHTDRHTHTHTHSHTHTQTQRQTHRQTDRETDRHRQTDTQTDTQRNTQTDTQTETQTDISNCQTSQTPFADLSQPLSPLNKPLKPSNLSNPSKPSADLSLATSPVGTCYTFSLPVQKATLGTAGPFSRARFEPVGPYTLFLPVQKATLGTPAFKPLKPLHRPFQGHKFRRYTCYTLFLPVQKATLGTPAFKPLKPLKRCRKPLQGHKSRWYMLHCYTLFFTGSESDLRHARLQTPPQAFPRPQVSVVYMLRFVFPGSESNVRHARLQTLQTPQTPPQAFPRPQVSQVYTCYTLLLPVQKATLGTTAFKPLKPKPSNPSTGLSKATSVAGILTGSESNVRHARLQTPQTPQAFARPQVSQVHATLCFYRFRSNVRHARLQTPQTPPQAFPRPQVSHEYTCSSLICFYRFSYVLFLPVQKATLGTPAFKPLRRPFQGHKSGWCTCYTATLRFLPVQKATLGTPAFKPLRKPFQGQKSRWYMLHFVFTGSESNVRHARLQTLETRQAPETPPQAFPRPQVSQVYMLHFALTGSESNLRHARLQTPQTPQTPPQAFQGHKSRWYMLHCYTLFLPVQKATLGTPAFKPLHRPFQGHKFRRHTCYNFFYRSESNVKHGRSAGPGFRPWGCFWRRAKLPFTRRQTPQTPQTCETSPQTFPRPQVSQVDAIHFLFTGSESNGRHGRSVQHTPLRAREAVFDGVQGCRLPAVKPLKPVKPLRSPFRPQVSQVHAMLSLYRFRKQR